MQFLAFMKMHSEAKNSFQSKQFLAYKEKVNHIARKVDRWHHRTSRENQGEFKQDSEFIMAVKSPAQYSDHSSVVDDDDKTAD